MHLCPGEHLSSGDHVYQVDNLQRTLAATATRETPDSIREKEFPYSASHYVNKGSVQEGPATAERNR